MPRVRQVDRRPAGNQEIVMWSAATHPCHGGAGLEWGMIAGSHCRIQTGNKVRVRCLLPDPDKFYEKTALILKG